MNKKNNEDYIHKEYPKTCDRKDFFGQVKRTVNGKPVSQEQIDMIISSINKSLGIEKEDILLDIGCGNGALSRYFFDLCKGFKGVDFSKYLIEIAKENFEEEPHYKFLNQDASSYVASEDNPEIYTKSLCYGCFSYLSDSDSRKFLKTLRDRFVNIKIFYIGNLPDKEKAKTFYRKGIDYKELLSDRNSPIGIWRTESEMKNIANECGWEIEFKRMPSEFYASHYRYDAILTPKK